MAKKLSFSWSTRREGNDGYVIERCDALDHAIEFGPIPAHIVPAFVEARRKVVHMKALSIGAVPSLDLEDYSYMQDDQQRRQ